MATWDSAKAKEYREKNKEAIKQKQKEWYLQNKVKVLERARKQRTEKYKLTPKKKAGRKKLYFDSRKEWYLRNKDRIIQELFDKYQENREEILKKKKEDYHKNKEVYIKRALDYYYKKKKALGVVNAKRGRKKKVKTEEES